MTKSVNHTFMIVTLLSKLIQPCNLSLGIRYLTLNTCFKIYISIILHSKTILYTFFQITFSVLSRFFILLLNCCYLAEYLPCRQLRNCWRMESGGIPEPRLRGRSRDIFSYQIFSFWWNSVTGTERLEQRNYVDHCSVAVIKSIHSGIVQFNQSKSKEKNSGAKRQQKKAETQYLKQLWWRGVNPCSKRQRR